MILLKACCCAAVADLEARGRQAPRDGPPSRSFEAPLRPQWTPSTIAAQRLESAANANAGAPVATGAVDRPHNRAATIAVAVAAMNAHCAARTDASRPVGTGRASGSVGFGGLNHEQTQNHQSGSDYLHHLHHQLAPRVRFCAYRCPEEPFSIHPTTRSTSIPPVA